MKSNLRVQFPATPVVWRQLFFIYDLPTGVIEGSG